jgi:hypothetical protein
MMLAIRTDFKNDEQATTAWADETTVSHVFFGLSTALMKSMTNDNNDRYESRPLSKEHIPPLLAFKHGLQGHPHKPRKQRAEFFVEIASSLVFPFSPPICCTSALSFSPLSF